MQTTAERNRITRAHKTQKSKSNNPAIAKINRSGQCWQSLFCCCDQWTRFVMIWKHSCFILRAPKYKLTLWCALSLLVGGSISASVTVTVTTVCPNSFGNRTSSSDNLNNRWKCLRLVSWAEVTCVWTIRAPTKNFTYLKPWLSCLLQHLARNGAGLFLLHRSLVRGKVRYGKRGFVQRLVVITRL